MIRFKVFGRLMGVQQRGGEWRPYDLGNEGRRRVADFIIPSELAVLFHEDATPERNEALRH